MTDTAETEGHTPGPWTNKEHRDFVWSKHGNVCACGDPHASTTVGYTPNEIGGSGLNEAVANARLIAAAPMLFDFAAAPALARILKFARGAAAAHKNIAAIELIDGLEALRAAAIARAGGRTP